MRRPVLAILIWLYGALASAADPGAERLANALRISEVVDILREEGLEHGTQLDVDMLEGAGGRYFAERVSDIYSAEKMAAALTSAMDESLSAEHLAQSTAFFESEVGRRIVALELSARIAFADPDVEAMAVARFQDLSPDDPAGRLIREYVEANDLIERNVDGIQTSSYSFYLGMVQDSGGSGDNESYLASLLEDREALVAETEEWAMSFHLMAYHPLSEAEQMANITFSQSAAGQALNDALFEGFDGMYEDIFFRLGRLVGRSMLAKDL